MAATSVRRSDVFINVPFDSDYENLFIALIAGLVGLGLNPRSVLQVPADADRLRRLQRIIAECPFSLHDLSRVQVSRSGPFRVARFNMPFELGLAAAIAESQGARAHQWRLLESVRNRLGQSLSDVAGYDPNIHGGTVEGMMHVLLDIFGQLPRPVLTDPDDLMWVYRKLSALRRTLRGAGVYRLNSFNRLVLAARVLTDERTARKAIE